MANAFVEELGKVVVDLNIIGAGQNRGFLEKRLTQARADLSLAEERLRGFQSANKALDVPEQAKVTIEGVALLRAELATQEVQLAALRSRLTDNTQEVRDLKASIGKLQHEIVKLEGAGGNGAIPSVGDLRGIGQEYVRLMREFKIQETLVELLTKQYEMARLTEARDVSTLQVLQEARAPDRKSKPKRSLIALLATLVTSLFAVFVAFLLEYVDHMNQGDRERLQEIRRLLRLRK
jgi:capsule polysaccharide export protein KpsE/RkpR